MKLQQLRYLVEVERQSLNVSEAAEALFTSQPGVSKQIRLLEDELGVTVFERTGKRLTAVTEPGRAVLDICRRILREADNLKRVGEEYGSGDSGSLVIATTHTQARYTLPPVIKALIEQYPKVRVSLRQGSPLQIAEWTLAGDADIAIATEAIDRYPELVALPCQRWSHCVIAPVGHPILEETLTLQSLSKYPLVTYDPAFAGRSRINQAFERQGLTPNVVLTAIDSDVIKTYVALGLGLGVVAQIAYDPQRDSGIRGMDAGHLFDSNITKIGLRRGVYLRNFDYALIHLFAPYLSRRAVELAMRGKGEDYQL
jgi:LysR family cys regulon transcriptional activator